MYDIRYGLRLLKRSPGFTAVAICSLGLGIGANTAIFSATKAVLLDSLPVSEPEQLRVLRWEFPGSQPMYALHGDLEQTKSGATTSTSFSYPLYQALQGHSEPFVNLAAFDPEPRQFPAMVDGDAEPISALMVSGNFFSTLDVNAAKGRTLLPSDDTAAGNSPVVEISDAYWTQRFGRSMEAIGKVIQVNRTPVTIIGVAPPGFTGPRLGKRPDLYVPLTMEPILDPSVDPLVSAGLSHDSLTDPERWWMALIGRIKPGVSDQQALVSLDGVFASTVTATLGKNHKDAGRLRLEISPGNRGVEPLNNQFSQTASLLIGVVGLVLLLACANLANLLLARSASRRRELALRIALGASRSRIMRQVLTESVVIALLGGVAGLALGFLTRNLVPDVLHQNLRVNFDWKVILFTLVISLATALLFGGFPAWQATLTDMQSVLQETARATPKKSKALLGKSLVVAQVCFSAVLLIGSGLFLRTLHNLMHSDLGFQPDRLLLFDVSLPDTQYKDDQSRAAMFHRLQASIVALPGVRATTFAGAALLTGETSTTNFEPNGDDFPKGKTAWLNVVGDDYFGTMGIPLVAGRGFGPQDSELTPKVAIINLRLAREIFSNRNPIGSTFNDNHIRIIGICGDAKFKDLRMDPPPTYYLPYWQSASSNKVTFAVRSQIASSSLSSTMRDVVHSIDQGLPITDVRTQLEQIDDSLGKETLFASLTGGFGIVALVLSCVGIYGITAYTVSRRTNEIGIRMALGARAGQVLSMVLVEACGLAGAGIAAAVILSFVLGRIIQSFLYGLRASDPLTLVLTGAGLIALTLVSSWIPARRAAHIDPVNALRHQ